MRSSARSDWVASSQPKQGKSKLRTALFILEVATIVGLLVIWRSSETIRQNSSLWVLFFYNFPSQFLIALVPHEPVVLYFGRFYTPLTVALVASAGTLVTEILNYSVFRFVADWGPLERMRSTAVFTKIAALFNKAPFAALLVAGFTPVPFYPFRFLVVLAHYPLAGYALAVFLSRTPRFYILAALGHEIDIPDPVLALVFAVLALTMYVPVFMSRLQGRRNAARIPVTAPEPSEEPGRSEPPR